MAQKIKYIIPCVCIDHYPDEGDSVLYGMPNIAVGQSGYSCYCPICGRGDKFLRSKTTYQAVKEWNELMTTLWVLHDDRDEIIEKIGKAVRESETGYGY